MGAIRKNYLKSAFSMAAALVLTGPAVRHSSDLVLYNDALETADVLQASVLSFGVVFFAAASGYYLRNAIRIKHQLAEHLKQSRVVLAAMSHQCVKSYMEMGYTKEHAHLMMRGTDKDRKYLNALYFAKPLSASLH